MIYSKHVPHTLNIAARGGARWRYWLAACAIIAAAAGLVQGNQHWQLWHLGHLWPSQTQVAQAATLNGEAAIQQLKTDGGYASLATAMAAARYQINAAPAQSSLSGQPGAPFYADNPGQQLRATFASDEVRVSATSKNPDGKESNDMGGAELRLQLAGYGYGEPLIAVTAGKITANGDRIAIRKSAIGNQPGPQSAITEWYVNKPEGLEQGFTIAEPPASSKSGEWLRVALSMGAPDRGWRVSVRGDGQGAVFERQGDGLRLGYDHLLAFDAQGRTLPARMELEGGMLALLVDDAHAAYPLTIDPILVQQAKLTAADGARADNFGFSVALSGNTAIIGAPLNDVTEPDQGAVYVFVRNGASWTQQQKLTASDGGANDRFGASVALSGDTVVVGASNNAISPNLNPAAYVFTRSGTVWAQQQKLKANDGAAGDGFGSAVAISGDTVVVGAPTSDISANLAQGAAYVFSRNGAGPPVWTQQQKLIASDGAATDFFGGSVALSGDTVVIGASNDDIGANADQGSAYVFSRSGAVWTQRQKLTANDGAATDFFGFSVALSGDTMVVGAPNDDNGANADQGAAYVFIRNGAAQPVWTQQQKLTASDGAANSFFGRSVAISGDTVLVGAPLNDIGANDFQGSAYVFNRSGAVWTQRQKLTAADGASGDFFGGAVALSGDTVLVGVFADDIGVNGNQGSAHVFVICAGNFVPQQPLTANDGAANDQFGGSVAVSGDTVVVGASSDDVGANVNQGSAYVFARSFTAGGAVWALQQKLTANDGEAGEGFGNAVAISDDIVLVGASFDTIATNAQQGSAYVFVRSGAGWTQQQKLTANDGAAFDQFGFSVAASGNTVTVGAPNDAVGATANQGSAYVFVRGGAGWTQQQKLTANDGAAGDLFGRSVALSGNIVVVGAPFDDIGANADQGSAYVFTRDSTKWTQQQKLIASDGVANDRFGPAVAISGDTLVVGAPNDAIGANTTQGSAYVFIRNGAAPPVWTQQQKLTANDGAANDNFGFSVSLSGDIVVVGAPFGDISTASLQGSAYVFTRDGTAQPVWTQQQKLIVEGGKASDIFGISVALSGDTVVVGAVGANVNQGLAYVFVCPAIMPNPVTCVSAASFAGTALASESIVAAFGNGLAQATETARTQPLPTTLASVRVRVRDKAGAEAFAPLFFVSPKQINFQMPPGLATGNAIVTVLRDNETVASGEAQIEAVAPGLFSADSSGRGLLIGFALRVKADGSQSFEPVVRFDEEKKQFVAAPINPGPETDQVFLVLFATGLRNRISLGNVGVKIGGVSADALYAGPQGSFTGLDQLNVLLPRSLAGRGELDVVVMVDGKQANTLKVAIK